MARIRKGNGSKSIRPIRSATVSRQQSIADHDVLAVDADAETEGQAKTDSSLARMLNALALFSTSNPSLTVEQIASQLRVPKSTAYRYVQELCKAGLLVRLDRSITLGPRIIELDRSIRECDPVIRAAIPSMRTLTDQTGLDVFISKLYGHSILTVHTEFDEYQHPLRYGRGRPVPMWRGSSAKALVAFLPAARLRRLHEELLLDREAGMPTWDSFYEDVLRIRRQGYCRTSGELNEGKTGISAPIFGRARVAVASITALGSDARVALFDNDAIARLVVRTAHTISARLSEDEHV